MLRCASFRRAAGLSSVVKASSLATIAVTCRAIQRFLSNTDMRRLRGRGRASVASLLEQSALGPRLEPIRHRCAQEKETYGRARWGSVSSPLPATTET